VGIDVGSAEHAISALDEQPRSAESRIDLLIESIPEPHRGKDARRHSSGFDLRGQLQRIAGVGLTQIDSNNYSGSPNRLLYVCNSFQLPQQFQEALRDKCAIRP
jgi:hypothetical protein